jgi:DNA-binding PadR family transcriptional regulator
VASRSVNATAMSLLGFLHQGPMTGWNLVATVEREIGDFWSVTQSQVYRELASMSELGFVQAGELGPRDRRPYSITDAGRQAFREWLATEPGPETIRFPLLLTVLFGDHLAPGRLGEFIQDHAQQHGARLAHYKTLLASIEAAPPEHAPNAYVVATLKFGLAYETMILDWFAALPAEVLGGTATP